MPEELEKRGPFEAVERDKPRAPIWRASLYALVIVGAVDGEQNDRKALLLAQRLDDEVAVGWARKPIAPIGLFVT